MNRNRSRSHSFVVACCPCGKSEVFEIIFSASTDSEATMLVEEHSLLIGDVGTEFDWCVRSCIVFGMTPCGKLIAGV